MQLLNLLLKGLLVGFFTVEKVCCLVQLLGINFMSNHFIYF